MVLLKQKSQEYSKAGTRLGNSGDYNVAIHSLYYSIYQYCSYLLNEMAPSGVSSHKWLQESIMKKLRQENISGTNEFLGFYEILKKSRIKADYRNEMVKQQEFLKCVNIHTEMERTLEKVKK